MTEFEESVQKIEKFFKKSAINTSIELNTALVVLDENKDRQSFILNLIEHLHVKTDSHLDFLYAVRGYLTQANQAGITLLTLPELTKIIRDRFSGHKECFDISFFPEGDISPYERIEEILEMRKIDLIVIPAPFTTFAHEENPSESSLGQTVDLLISKALIDYNSPHPHLCWKYRHSPLHLPLLRQHPEKSARILPYRRACKYRDFPRGLKGQALEDKVHPIFYYLPS